MDCRELKEHLYAFLDGESDEQTNCLIKEHLLACSLCRLELGQEKKIDFLIRSGIPREKAPYRLREEVLNKIEGLRKQRRSQFVGFFLKPVFAAGAIVFLGLILISYFFISIHRPFPVFSESVKGHIKFLQGNLPVGITAHKAKEAGEWLRARLDFKIMVPELSSLGVNLSGARIYNLKDRQAAYLGYEKNGHDISVFMFDAQGLKFPKAKKVAVNNKIFYLTKERGYNSALWLEQGIACVFVSDLDEAELLYLASL